MYRQFKRIKDQGLLGRNKGIKFPLLKLATTIPNIQKSKFYIIAAASGVGKSAFINEMFVFNAYDEIIKNPATKLRIIYWSLELPKEYIITRLLVRWLKLKHNILVDSDYLLSQGDKKLDPFINELLESQECIDYVEGFGKIVDIRDDKLTYISAAKQIDTIAEEQGVIKHKDLKVKGDVWSVFDDYMEHDKDQYTIFIVDHISLIGNVKGESKKQSMDALTEVVIKARNRYKFTFVFAQQLNRGFSSTDSRKLELLLPTSNNFKDSNATIEGCDVAIGLMSPYREGLDDFLNYRIKPRANDPLKHGFKNRMLVANIIKNRTGESNKVYPLYFEGETGIMQHIDKTPAEIDYNAINKGLKHYSNEQ